MCVEVLSVAVGACKWMQFNELTGPVLTELGELSLGFVLTSASSALTTSSASSDARRRQAVSTAAYLSWLDNRWIRRARLRAAASRTSGAGSSSS